MKIAGLIAMLAMCAGSIFAQQDPAAELQMKNALLAAPQEQRDSATVMGYSPGGELIVLRKGTNGMICLADDPDQKGFNVACYHQNLDPFMARGRALKKEGKTSQEIFDLREQEVKAGKLKMPAQPATLYVYSATQEKYDSAKGVIQDGYLRYVIYIPYATSETTGLPLKPDAPGQPWIMDPGTHRAHIMISPPKEK